MNFCSHCGVLMPLPDPVTPSGHPHCPECATTHWTSPKPVAVLLQPIWTGEELGLVVACRGNQPQIGGLAMPGGFVEKGEKSTDAAVREFGEECGMEGIFNEHSTQIVCERPTAGGQLLIFVQNHERLFLNDLKGLKNTAEMHDWQYISLRRNPALCFPTHQEVAQAWLLHHAGKQVASYQFPQYFR